MAIYEDLSSNRPSIRPRGRAILAVAMEHPFETLRLGLVALLVGLWLIAAYAGIVFWALQGSLVGVMASAVVPGLAAASTWGLYVKLGSQRVTDTDRPNPRL